MSKIKKKYLDHLRDMQVIRRSEKLPPHTLGNLSIGQQQTSPSFDPQHRVWIVEVLCYHTTSTMGWIDRNFVRFIEENITIAKLNGTRREMRSGII